MQRQMFRNCMPYPIELLPLPEYKDQIEISQLLAEHGTLYLLRKSTKGCGSNNPVKVREFLPRDIDLFGCSLFSFGNYNLDHFKFKPTVEDTPWKKNNGSISASDVQYENEDPSVLPLFILIMDIHNKPFPIIKNQSTKSEETIQTTIFVDHKPRSFNYWHFEFTVYVNENESEVSRNVADKTGYIKKAASSFAELHLKHLFTKVAPSPVIMGELLYKDY